VHSPADLFEQPVSLLHVVMTTGRHDVRPIMTATPAARHDVINGVGVLEAVRTSVAVAKQE